MRIKRKIKCVCLSFPGLDDRFEYLADVPSLCFFLVCSVPESRGLQV